MAKLPSQFNSENAEVIEDFPVIQPGWYKAILKESDLLENRAKTGSYLKLVFKITEGDYANRLVFSNLNLYHPNSVAVQIAEKEFGTLCKACGKNIVTDTEDLHGIEIEIKLAVRAATAQFPESNEIKNYRAIEGEEKPSAASFQGGNSKPTQTGETSAKAQAVTFD